MKRVCRYSYLFEKTGFPASDIDVETPLKVAVLVVPLLAVPLPVAELNVLVALV